MLRDLWVFFFLKKYLLVFLLVCFYFGNSVVDCIMVPKYICYFLLEDLSQLRTTCYSVLSWEGYNVPLMILMDLWCTRSMVSEKTWCMLLVGKAFKNITNFHQFFLCLSFPPSPRPRECPKQGCFSSLGSGKGRPKQQIWATSSCWHKTWKGQRYLLSAPKILEWLVITAVWYSS